MGLVTGFISGLLYFLYNKKSDQPDSIEDKLEEIHGKINQNIDSDSDFIANRRKYPKIDKIP
jgi:hypothetical protein